ncbi:glycoside hydrolase family 140 protein [Mesorhizobium sp. BR115XR7A]|uniref:apiosidase-like domain-containing protein n=1 Tax=Mesorhizobium sp. BR115XR7A TaxID=2876645 RepID=UPI001CCF6EE7|nr:DUF4038 domain-containing protein [Mesorhizobium sp. BR115XR7A]MBZ9905237.1 glycoside hydrolase family 140 protein [Mesorhizobium sp. BR115XR7A]MBZ9931088.1 glycoside hydrolase family 140 protein [Mesorhizobium sp. BR1-1-5]
MQMAPFLLAGALVAAMTMGSLACQSDSGTKFPLRIESGKSYPLDKDGRPFFMQGDSPWSLISDLTEEDADLYLEDRKARGFNTVLVNLLEHRFSRNAPANAYGEKPFADHGDFVAPNEAYFAHADRILQKACDLGFLVLLAPAYLGYGGGADGWYREMSAAGVGKLNAFGHFVGRRYRHFDNIMWVNGGDYNPADKDLVRALAKGIMDEDPDALSTVHGASDTAPLDFWGREPWLKVNNVFTYGPVYTSAIREYNLSRGMPFFLMETAYEFEYGANEYRIRIQAYQAILSGAFGHLYGNNPIWHFGGPGLFRETMSWKEALDSPGAKSMGVLFALMSSIKWWLLEPDSKNRLLVDGTGKDTGRAVAATAKDGSYAVVYMPANDRITVDLAQLSAASVRARWRDPTSGELTDVEGSPFKAERTVFQPPELNSRGYRDWILELIAQGRPEAQSQ